MTMANTLRRILRLSSSPLKGRWNSNAAWQTANNNSGGAFFRTPVRQANTAAVSRPPVLSSKSARISANGVVLQTDRLNNGEPIFLSSLWLRDSCK